MKSRILANNHIQECKCIFILGPHNHILSSSIVNKIYSTVDAIFRYLLDVSSLPKRTDMYHFQRKSKPEERTIPVILACICSKVRKCDDCGGRCKITCPNNFFNWVVTGVTGSELTHCETYFPKTGATFTIGGSVERVGILTGRKYDSELDNWIFFLFTVSERERDGMVAYFTSRLDCEYDNASLVKYIPSKLCSPFVWPDKMKFSRYEGDIPIYAHSSSKETCARLAIGALVSAEIIAPLDVSAVSCGDVYQAITILGISAHEKIPYRDSGLTYIDPGVIVGGETSIVHNMPNQITTPQNTLMYFKGPEHVDRSVSIMEFYPAAVIRMSQAGVSK